MRPLEQAAKYPAALKIVRERVKPERERSNDKGFREKWWQFGRPRGETRQAFLAFDQYLATARHGKRLLITWVSTWTMTSDPTNVFAFDDDYSMGILTSATHNAWAWNQSSTLKGDIRYTPTTVFATFPWPDPVSPEQREAVAELCRKVIARRQEICATRRTSA